MRFRLIALAGALCALAGCATHKKPSLNPTYRWTCDVLSYDAKTQHPNQMKCPDGVWRKQ